MITPENVREGLKVFDKELKTIGYISECNDIFNVFVIFIDENSKMLGSGFYCVDNNSKNYSKELILLQDINKN